MRKKIVGLLVAAALAASTTSASAIPFRDIEVGETYAAAVDDGRFERGLADKVRVIDKNAEMAISRNGGEYRIVRAVEVQFLRPDGGVRYVAVIRHYEIREKWSTYSARFARR